MNLYITTQGAYVKKSGGTIVIEKAGERISAHPTKDISTLIIFGHIQVTVQAMLALLEHGCDIAMMTQHGRFRGRMVSAYTRNVPFRIHQYQKYTDPHFRLGIARRLIGSKVKNAVALLKAYRHSSRTSVDIECSALLHAIQSIESAESIESLRGYEGTAARLYFAQFAKCIKPDNISFAGRRFHPSTDPVNALLSFGYSFVARELQAILEAVGFDPYIGFYHEIDYGRASLSYDLLEEFRHCLIDRLVLRLVNKQIIQPDDFYTDENDGGCYLQKESLNKFIHHYEQYVAPENVSYRPAAHRFSYRKMFNEQAVRLKHAVENGEPYVPYQHGVE